MGGLQRRGVLGAALAGAVGLVGCSSGAMQAVPAAAAAAPRAAASKPAAAVPTPGAAVPERGWVYPQAPLHPALHLVGDSTLADKPDPPERHPERGWGQLLRAQALEPQRIVNHAANGRSTRRFVDEGRWSHLLTQLQRGDHVLIQFGHNDQKDDDPRRYAAADTDFKAYLRQFVADVRAKGATPLLATPVARRKFDASGQVVQTLGAWPQALRDVAAETGVVLIDMNMLTTAHLETLGPEASKAQFMWLQPGQWAAFAQGRQDDTHYVEAGARATALLAVQALRQQVPALAGWFR